MLTKARLFQVTALRFVNDDGKMFVILRATPGYMYWLWN